MANLVLSDIDLARDYAECVAAKAAAVKAYEAARQQLDVAKKKSSAQ